MAGISGEPSLDPVEVPDNVGDDVGQVGGGNLDDGKDMDVDGGMLGVTGTGKEPGPEVEGELLKEKGGAESGDG